jgi:hypothetical protein
MIREQTGVQSPVLAKNFQLKFFNGLSDKGRSMAQIQPRWVTLPQHQFFLAESH